MAKTGRETALFTGNNNLISIIDLSLFTSIPDYQVKKFIVSQDEIRQLST